MQTTIYSSYGTIDNSGEVLKKVDHVDLQFVKNLGQLLICTGIVYLEFYMASIFFNEVSSRDELRLGFVSDCMLLVAGRSNTFTSNSIKYSLSDECKDPLLQNCYSYSKNSQCFTGVYDGKVLGSAPLCAVPNDNIFCKTVFTDFCYLGPTRKSDSLLLISILMLPLACFTICLFPYELLFQTITTTKKSLSAITSKTISWLRHRPITDDASSDIENNVVNQPRL